MIYLYFCGDLYYPLGGLNDLAHVVVAQNDAAAVEEVRKLRNTSHLEEWEQLVAVDETGARLVPLSPDEKEMRVPVSEPLRPPQGPFPLADDGPV